MQMTFLRLALPTPKAETLGKTEALLFFLLSFLLTGLPSTSQHPAWPTWSHQKPFQGLNPCWRLHMHQLSISLRHHKLLSIRQYYLHFIEKGTHPCEWEDPPKSERQVSSTGTLWAWKEQHSTASLMFPLPSTHLYMQVTRTRAWLNQNLMCNWALTSCSLTGDIVHLCLRWQCAFVFVVSLELQQWQRLGWFSYRPQNGAKSIIKRKKTTSKKEAVSQGNINYQEKRVLKFWKWIVSRKSKDRGLNSASKLSFYCFRERLLFPGKYMKEPQGMWRPAWVPSILTTHSVQ